jgi:hypothetical protein
MEIEISSNTPEVCEIGLAREILYRAGFGARREGDFLLVFAETPLLGFYQSKHIDEKPIGQLYVDEGHFGNCLQNRINGKIDAVIGSAIWFELVDWTELLAILVKKFVSGAKIKESPVSGRGGSKRHYLNEYTNALKDVKIETKFDKITFN